MQHTYQFCFPFHRLREYIRLVPEKFYFQMEPEKKYQLMGNRLLYRSSMEILNRSCQINEWYVIDDFPIFVFHQDSSVITYDLSVCSMPLFLNISKRQK